MRQNRQRRFRATIGGTDGGRVYPSNLWGERGRYCVAGTINGTKFRSRLDQSGNGYFLPLGPAWRRSAGLRPGDVVDVVDVLILDESPPREGLSPDVADALEADPEAGRFFDALAGFYRKNYLRWIAATKRRPDIREARIAELVELM